LSVTNESKTLPKSIVLLTDSPYELSRVTHTNEQAHAAEQTSRAADRESQRHNNALHEADRELQLHDKGQPSSPDEH
jgi:hypothetical protein